MSVEKQTEKQTEKIYTVREVSAEVKAKFKEKYGKKLHSLILPLDDFNNENLEVLAIVPPREIVSLYLKFLQSDPNKAQEVLVKNCLLTSKEEVLEDDALFYAAADLLMELVPIRKGKLSKV